MYRQAIIAAGGGAISGMLFAGILGGGLGAVLAYFSPLPLLMVGLSAGMRSASIAILVGLVATGVMAGGPHALIFGGAIVLPSWLAIRYALLNQVDGQGRVNWYPAGNVLCYLAGLGGVILVLAALGHLGYGDGFQSTVRGYVDQFIEFRFRNFSSDIDRAPIVDRFAPLFPGTAVASWLLMLTLNTVLAQGTLARLGRNLRPTPAYSRITIPEWIYWAIVISAVGALFGDGDVEFVSRNLVVVFATPFFFVGLGIVHLVIRRLSLPGMALTVFYVFLLFLGWPAVAVAGLGFVEEWAGLRDKYGPRPNLKFDEEEEE